MNFIFWDTALIHVLCSSCQKITLIHWCWYLNETICNCPLISPIAIFCQQQVNRISQSSTSNMWQGYQQKVYFGHWQYKTTNVSSQSNLTAQVHVVLYIFIGVISDKCMSFYSFSLASSLTSALILLPFLFVVLHESGTRNA